MAVEIRKTQMDIVTAHTQINKSPLKRGLLFVIGIPYLLKFSLLKQVKNKRLYLDENQFIDEKLTFNIITLICSYKL